MKSCYETDVSALPAPQRSCTTTPTLGDAPAPSSGTCSQTEIEEASATALDERLQAFRTKE